MCEAYVVLGLFIRFGEFGSYAATAEQWEKGGATTGTEVTITRRNLRERPLVKIRAGEWIGLTRTATR